jgi:hypothetical protein
MFWNMDLLLSSVERASVSLGHVRKSWYPSSHSASQLSKPLRSSFVNEKLYKKFKAVIV